MIGPSSMLHIVCHTPKFSRKKILINIQKKAKGENTEIWEISRLRTRCECFLSTVISCTVMTGGRTILEYKLKGVASFREVHSIPSS